MGAEKIGGQLETVVDCVAKDADALTTHSSDLATFGLFFFAAQKSREFGIFLFFVFDG